MGWLDRLRGKKEEREPIEFRHVFCAGCGQKMHWAKKAGSYDRESGWRKTWEEWECVNGRAGHDGRRWWLDGDDDYVRNLDLEKQ
jgi:hypothetical protein